jgi:hypothetical protein
MLLEQLIEMKWNPNNREWFESKGYIFTKYRSPILVRAHDLSEKCNKKVDIKCDYCGKTTNRAFSDYTDSLKECVVKRDSCMKCKPLKNKEVYNLLYGVDHQSQVPLIKEKMASAQRLDYEFVKNEFESVGYQLISKQYKNAKQPLEFICDIHKNEGTQRLEYSNFQQGRRCQYCNMDERRVEIKEKYKTIVERKNFTFIDVAFKGYKTQKIVLEIVCNIHFKKGSQFVLSSNFEKQSGCKYCGREKQGVSKRAKIEDVESIFLDRGYDLIKDFEYKSNKTELNYICLKHIELGIQITDYANISRAKTCRSCIFESITGENHYLWKGGVSPLHNYLRCKIGDWKKESLKLHNYRCVISGKKGKLVVHHLVSFSAILRETMDELMLGYFNIGKYSNEELDFITKLFLDKHSKYGYGVPLYSEIHDLFHSVYGRGDTTLGHFEEFKERYITGEFKEVS